LAERHQQNKEELDKQACHQVFRITKGEKDDSYEWYKNRVENRVEGTCEWFLTHENFQSWLKTRCRTSSGLRRSWMWKVCLGEIPDRLWVTSSRHYLLFFLQGPGPEHPLTSTLCLATPALFSKIWFNSTRSARVSQEWFRRSGPDHNALEHPQRCCQDPAAGSTIFVSDALDECAEMDFRDLVRMLIAFFL
jgi:hypothetical protein